MTIQGRVSFGLRGLIGAGPGVLLSGCSGKTPPENTAKPLRQHAYVWQRDCIEAVREAVMEHSRDFAELEVLGAQVSWESGGRENRSIRLRRVSGRRYRYPVLPYRRPSRRGANGRIPSARMEG
jgi:hypothetical protein